MIVTVLWLALQDEFPKLQEAWKAAREVPSRTFGLTDEYVRAMGRVAAALEAAGCFAEDAAMEKRAMKRLVLRRAAGPSVDMDPRMLAELRARGLAGPDSVDVFEKAVARLKQVGDDEDLRAEASVEVRKALKDLAIVSDEMPQWMRRRIQKLAQALAAGDAYPAAERATAEQEKRIAALTAQLGDAEMEKRDEASRELEKIGEAAVPLVREALKSGDAEVRERAKRFLGVGLKDPEHARGPERRAVLSPVPAPVRDR